MICSRCNAESPEGSSFCQKCGAELTEKISPENRGNGITKILYVLCACFLVFSTVFFSKAHNVKTEYYNSEDYSILNKNAYVGGDAYNYIINGTYFTAYSVIASAGVLCSVVCFCTASVIKSMNQNE